MFGLNPYSIALKVAIAFVIAGLAAFVTHRFDLAKYEKLELQYAQATAKVQAQSYAIATKDMELSVDAAAREATVQQQIAVATITLTKELTRYVTDTIACIPYGLIRVLDAAALGVDPATLSLPAGKSDNSCAPVTSSTLAASIIENYGTARANEEQLKALETFSRGQAKLTP